MRVRTTVFLVVTLWTPPLMAGGQDSVSRTPDRIGRLEQWLEVVEQHEFGTGDDALMRVASWDRNTLWLVWQDVSSVVSLVREPDVSVFYTPIELEPFSGIFRLPATRRRTRVIPYGREDLKRLKLIAKHVTDRGGEDRILKRGAVLHAEIATLEAEMPVRDPARRTRSNSVMLFLTDGQQTGIDDAGVQWEMGRRLLDRVRPKDSRKLGSDPGADETVRLWYLASNLYMQSVEQVDAWHVDHSVELFPRDPEMLFVAACAREVFSGPQIQNVLLSTTLSRELFNLYGDESEELGRAERLYRQSLERDPNRTEARIRLGRILNRRGRYDDAIVELRRATMTTKNRLLLYYGHLFLGDAANALGLADEARRAYERAGELFELAQSPRLAISAMAARGGDRPGALAAIDKVLGGDEPLRADDPWWSYYTSQTRDLQSVWTALRLAVTAERARQ